MANRKEQYLFKTKSNLVKLYFNIFIIVKTRIQAVCKPQIEEDT